jgi:hypothetical protein
MAVWQVHLARCVLVNFNLLILDFSYLNLDGQRLFSCSSLSRLRALLLSYH